ncbi:DNA repair protein RecO [Devosia sp. MC532]|uniref:DNA repair protein RecO n=1 Tax=Devosia sp. MC532 TaxID=2799788 RepID=UPI0018F5273D|nr:DNA repair protein RecO [Devosia sp. MC532]MBJ7576745.1 DNA repair protein RecO [Devosia sp. MC532]
MEWTGEGLLIGAKRQGETSLIAEVMVAGRGRQLGMIRGGRSPKLAAALQPGNVLQVTWRSRLESQLGFFTVELLHARAAELIADRDRLYLAQTVFEHLHLLPEREAADRLLGMALRLIDAKPDAIALVRFELALLDELGFGLDLTQCGATGATHDLTHVSPRTGRAVCREAAEPYRDRLLKLPSFLFERGNASPDDIRDAFTLTEHFLKAHFWSTGQAHAPATRAPLVENLTKH